jgi:hypothetical protein
MQDLISRQAAIDALRTCYDTETVTYTNGNEYIDYDQELDLLNSLPTVQPEPSILLSWIEKPVIHAHWIPTCKPWSLFSDRTHKCSCCGHLLYMDGVNCGRGIANYCPNCGARMNEE